MLRLKIILVCLIVWSINGCGSPFGDSYDEDLANDLAIVKEIIKENPILQSAQDSGHYFLPMDTQYSRITGLLNLDGLDLNDSNFYLPKSINNFKLVKFLSFASNDFSDLPVGTKGKNWKRVVAWFNKICNPSSETVTYLDVLMKDFGGPYWRDSQHGNDSIPAVVP